MVRQFHTFKGRIFVTLVGSFVAMLITAGALIHFSQLRQLESSIEKGMRGDERVFQAQIANDAEGLSRALTATSRVDSLLDAFVARNRDELYRRARPLFDELKAQYRITHFYFFEPDGTTFLRVHKPEQFGDRNGRNSFQLAAGSDKLAVSLDMGKNFFSLRAVRPIVRDGQKIGYWELAEEIDHVLPSTKAISGDDVAVLLSDTYTKRKGTDVKGEHLDGMTLLDATDKPLATAVVREMGLQRDLDEPNLRMDSRYAVMAFPFRDGAGETAGILVFIRDIQAARSELYHIIVRNLSATSSCYWAAPPFSWLCGGQSGSSAATPPTPSRLPAKSPLATLRCRCRRTPAGKTRCSPGSGRCKPGCAIPWSIFNAARRSSTGTPRN